MQIKIFTPPKFEKKALDINYLDALTNKKWQYASNGRSSIYHILKDLNIDKILIPIYICETVLEPLKKLNIKPIFYDLDIEDLNPSLESIKKLSNRYDVKAVLVASMYGNPANLVDIERYCKESGIFMIDDSAQSFGAKLDNRYVGIFGDAGFFSFSPGKPTAGHMGSFFWSKNSIEIERSNHCLIHYFRWLDFYYNRYQSYDKKSKIINLISRGLLKFVDIKNDKICNFEKEILGGILSMNLNGTFSFSEEYYQKFIQKFKSSSEFSIISPIRGNFNPHKIVIIFNSKKKALAFVSYMFDCSIYVINGYTLLNHNLDETPNAKSIEGRVVELPIENNIERMKYLFQKVEEFD